MDWEKFIPIVYNAAYSNDSFAAYEAGGSVCIFICICLPNFYVCIWIYFWKDMYGIGQCDICPQMQSEGGTQ